MSGGSYYVPASSKWPILAGLAVGLFMLGTGILLVFDTGWVLVPLGVLAIVSVMALWFRLMHPS